MLKKFKLFKIILEVHLSWLRNVFFIYPQVLKIYYKRLKCSELTTFRELVFGQRKSKVLVEKRYKEFLKKTVILWRFFNQY